jgi:large subunit ribosomal protein L27
MSKTKAAGSTHLGRDSAPKYLGIKLSEGQKAKIGSIIIRQRGSKFIPGKNVKQGKDDTLYAMAEGVVRFVPKKKIKFDKKEKVVSMVSVETK